MKLLIHNKNPAIHSATLDFRITFNETDSLDSQNQTPTKNDEKQEVCLEGKEYSCAELENSVTVIQISTIQI